MTTLADVSTKKGNTQYIDLDLCLEKTPRVVFKLDGEEHEVKEMTVEDWIEVTKEIEAMPAEASTEQELSALQSMVHRRLPSISHDRLMKLTMYQLGVILEFARQNNGEEAAETEMAAAQDTAREVAASNPPTTE